MIGFVQYLIATGEIVGAGACLPGDLALQERAGVAALQSNVGHPLTHKVVAGAVVEYTPAGKARLAAFPGAGYRWDPATEDWIDERPIGTVRAELLVALRTKRDALLEGGFTWDGSPFDSDTAVSQPRILGLFTTAIAGGIPPEGYPWRLADNTWRVLSAADATAVWGAFQAHMAGLFQAFAVHEAAVAAETDIAVLRAYDVEAGWP